MEFISEKKETVILNPSKNMEEKRIPSEIRTDPLTGRTARICHFMELKWSKPDLERLVSGTQSGCPFCPERVLKVTPCFPEEIIKEGRMISEDMVLFPNLAPYDSLGAVATMGERHFTPMTEFSKERIAKAFALGNRFFERIRSIKHPESKYGIINWNYMPVAGSSLIHAHLQVFSTSSAPNLMRQELIASREYLAREKKHFWDEFIRLETEQKSRFLGTIGRSFWFSSYAPIGVAGDVLAVVKGAHSTSDLSDDDLYDLADGLVRAMAAYDKMGIYSFNMNFFTGAREDEHTYFHLLFTPRTFFNQALGTPDIGALRNLFNETLCMAYPEEITIKIRPFFASPV